MLKRETRPNADLELADDMNRGSSGRPVDTVYQKADEIPRNEQALQ